MTSHSDSRERSCRRPRRKDFGRGKKQPDLTRFPCLCAMRILIEASETKTVSVTLTHEFKLRNILVYAESRRGSSLPHYLMRAERLFRLEAQMLSSRRHNSMPILRVNTIPFFEGIEDTHPHNVVPNWCIRIEVITSSSIAT